MKRGLIILVLLVVAVGCDLLPSGPPPGRCRSDDQCNSGMKCDLSRERCVCFGPMCDDAGADDTGPGGAGGGTDGGGGDGADEVSVMGCQSNQDCVVPGLLACDLSIHQCVGCTGNSNCSGTTPTCDKTVKMCVGCLANTDCSGAMPICDTAAKTCATGCLGAVDCGGTTPVCDTSVKACVGCLANTDCGGTTPVCNTTTKTCVRCLARADCSGTTPACDTTVKMCVGCLANTDCSGTTPVCNTATKTCVGCLARTDCSGTTPACDMAVKMCVGCLANTDCGGTTPVCNTTTKTCVGCVARTDCSGATPACDTTAKMCVGCLVNTDCSGTTPVCNTATKACVRCLARGDCSGATPACDTTVKMCVGCLANTDCGGTTPVCNTATKTCVGCLARTDCSGTTPACDTTVKVCVGCLANPDCSGATAVCDTSAKTCVQCLTSTDCSGATPICDAKVCRVCRADSECVTKLGANPGVCMTHQDGRCGTDAETIYVQSATGCSDSGTGTASVPFCSMQPTVATVGAVRDLIVVRGTVVGATAAFSGVARQVSIVGQTSALIAGLNPAIHMSTGSLYARELRLATGASIGCQADPTSTLRMEHVNVTSNSGGGILLNGANFDIRNTTVTTNGPGTFGLANWGGVLINNPPPAGPKQLTLVTVQSNIGSGISCSAAIQGTGVLATGNTPVDINTTCGIIACGTASATCGAMP